MPRKEEEVKLPSGAAMPMPELKQAPAYATGGRHPSQSRAFMDSYAARKNVLRHNEALMDWGKQQMQFATKERGQDLESQIAGSRNEIMQELGLGELKIKQQDLDLDREAWDFAQNRYKQFGKRADILGLLKGMGATQDMLSSFGIDVPEWFDEEFGGMFGQTQDRKSSLRATPQFDPSGITAPFDEVPQPTTTGPDLNQVQPQFQPQGGIAGLTTPRPAQGQSQFVRDWSAASDWFGDTFRLNEVEEILRSIPRRTKDYFTR